MSINDAFHRNMAFRSAIVALTDHSNLQQQPLMNNELAKMNQMKHKLKYRMTLPLLQDAALAKQHRTPRLIYCILRISRSNVQRLHRLRPPQDFPNGKRKEAKMMIITRIAMKTSCRSLHRLGEQVSKRVLVELVWNFVQNVNVDFPN